MLTSVVYRNCIILDKGTSLQNCGINLAQKFYFVKKDVAIEYFDIPNLQIQANFFDSAINQLFVNTNWNSINWMGHYIDEDL